MILHRKKATAIVLVGIFVVLFCLSVSAELVTVAPDGRYFQRGDQAFLIIGPNDALTWPGLSPLLGDVAPHAAEAYVQKLSEHGVNTLRVMLEYAQTPTGWLEDPIGEFNPKVVAFWDTFFEWLEKYDIYAIVTPWDPFWMKPNWSANPYNVLNGGMMTSMNGFLTQSDAILAQKARFEFAIKRWGHSEHILAWELMNEIELWWGASAYDIEDWITEMAQFVRATQMRYHGFTQLITASTAAAMPSGRLGDVIYNHPELDFANTHLYTGPGMNAPRNTTDVVEEVGLAVNYAQWMIKDRRPYTDTESGPIEMWIGSSRFDAEFLHNVSWAHLASGGAGTGMRWPYRTPHILSDEMLGALKRISLFVEEFNFTGFSPDNLLADIIVPVDHYSYGIGDGERSLLWIVRSSAAQGEESGLYVELDYILPGTYKVRYWSPWDAIWIDEEILHFQDNQGSFTTPSFLKDITIVLERIVKE